MSRKLPELLRIEELEGEDCLRLRPLWEEVFWEDSAEFTDYYFHKKAVRNHAFVLKVEEETVSMLYLSPYPVLLRTGNSFTEEKINYIVGVATKEKYRHRGYMDRILREALAFMREKGQPFTFLMPADPHIYWPYQFAYIYDKEVYIRKEPIGQSDVIRERSEMQDFQRLAEYASAYLRNEYDVFIKRDSDYYQGMEKELKVQNGGISLLYGRDRSVEGLEGYFFYTEEEGKEEIQEALCTGRKETCPVCFSGRKQPVIMARIADIKSMLSLLRTEKKEIFWSVKVRDTLLHENSGVWKCRIAPDKAYISKEKDYIPEEGEAAGTVFECETEIDRLTGWIFGYRKDEECFTFPKDIDADTVLCKIREIKQLSRVFINEIV